MARDITKGMWVRHERKTAIVARIEGDAAVIHYVDEDGETVLPGGIKPVGFGWSEACDVHVPVDSLKQAKASQIPAKRVKGVSAARLAQLGYE